MHHRHRILNGNKLFTRLLDVFVGASEGGQDECGATVHQVAAVELGGDLHGQGAVAQRGLGDGGVGRRGGEVAAHPDEDTDLAVPHGPDRVDSVEAVLAGRGDSELGIQCGQK
ncbi:Uncharacterised protein [Mycobacteroides abscessus subsp. massiliense]|nr:Uncharacterised protein [Mycobacteroides abscessus subsp. massiliense]